MKKIMGFGLLGIFLSMAAYAIPRNVSYNTALGPSTSTSNIVIGAAGTGLRNCITSVTTISDSTYTFRLLDGNTTDYSLLLNPNQGLAQDFNPQDPWCGQPNTPLTLSVDNGNFIINYQGYTF